MSINPTNQLLSSVKPKEQLSVPTLNQKPASKKNVLTKKIAKIFKNAKQVPANSKSMEYDPLKRVLSDNASIGFAETLDTQAPTLLETGPIFYQMDHIETQLPLAVRPKTQRIIQRENPIENLQKILNQWLEDSSIKRNYINQSSNQKAPNCTNALQRILAFFQNTDEKVLDLSNLNLTSLPDVFYFPSFLNRLSEITLSQNNLTSLPQSFKSLQALTVLDLTDNSFAEFPELLVKLPNLKYLDLSKNQLTQLPESLTELRALQALLVRGNQLTELPIDLGKLDKLEILELGINQLKNLPESCVNLKNLKDLSISHNQFVRLPEFIGSLSRLEELRIRNNQIQDLPESLIQLKALKKIYLAYTCLSELSLKILCQLPDCSINGLEYTSLCQRKRGSYQEDQSTSKEILNQWKQKNIGQEPANRVQALHNVRSFCKNANTNTLNLRKLDLTDLPNIFHFEPFVSRLEHLDISGNKLQELPPSICSLKALKTLNLSNNQFHNESLADLPELFLQSATLIRLELDGNRLNICPKFLCNLPNLKVLNISKNDLLCDLEALGSLQNLKDLDLSYNSNLAFFTHQILHLPCIDRIDLTGCDSLHSVFLNTVRETIAGLDRVLHISYPLPSLMEAEEPIEQSLKRLCQIAKREPIDLCALLKVREVRSWLNRLFSIADFQQGGNVQEALAVNVLDCLHEANNNPDFRQVFTHTIRDATESCADRVALSFIDARLAYRLVTIDIHNMRELADFLIKGPCSIAILKELAQQFILQSSSSVDQIEVHLGLLVTLKRELDLPIDIEKMSHFKFSELTPKDLHDAKQYVLKMRKDSYYELLISQDKWKEALKKHYSSKFKEIEEKRDAAMQEGKDEEAIVKKFNKRLIKLTKTALQAESSR
ncbi:leucine-rich repeat domain-containing protein [Candidatus Rhabdochlamydia porcellionis]|uniref:Leucine rich repeat n=1 Tax=Candidatus Rhabdochlamydia porcellionis TaxID=225148 RepID=A0ABX8Z1F5_9BACT|nr:leucine-rich repeat domain-containing protein [Candidatus Rhabdochlamydia porcellionis]QZA58748.1 Leucine rich repeat [Candidatus Rhabdochlamydia porcellionis]